MSNPRAIAVVADREHADAVRILTDLGWTDAVAMLDVAPILIAVAYTEERVRKHAPLLIGVPDPTNLDIALHTASRLPHGQCDWYVACDAPTTVTVRNVLRLAERPGGHA